MQKTCLADLIITKVCSASTLYTPENARLKRNNRARWAIVYKYEGETIYTFRGTQLISDAGRVIFLPQSCSYEWHCTKAGHYSILELECTATGGAPFSIPVKNGDQILKLFRELEYKRSRKDHLTEIESIRDVYSLLLALAHAGAEPYSPTEKQRRIAPALEYMAQNCNRALTNDELAVLTGLSTVYFRKLFTVVMGVSPMVYARQLRIEKAKEILRSDYGTLSDVAQSLGYASLYDFSRDFKKHTGVAPSHY